MGQEAHDRQEAQDAAGILRELERWCGDSTKQLNPQLEPIRGLLDSKLRIAETLLGPNDDISSTINHLRFQFGRAEEFDIELIQRNIIFMALVARALEERFHLRSGGGYGDSNFSITGVPQILRPKAI
jgi:hypothetical protein